MSYIIKHISHIICTYTLYEISLYIIYYILYIIYYILYIILYIIYYILYSIYYIVYLISYILYIISYILYILYLISYVGWLQICLGNPRGGSWGNPGRHPGEPWEAPGGTLGSNLRPQGIKKLYKNPLDKH